MTILQPFFFFFWTAELIFLGRLVIENPIFFFLKKKISGAILIFLAQAYPRYCDGNIWLV